MEGEVGVGDEGWDCWVGAGAMVPHCLTMVLKGQCFFCLAMN